MISLREFFTPGKMPGPTLDDVRKNTDGNSLAKRSTEVHQVAKDFEQTVKDFLDERQAQHKAKARY